jgi:hypothetical protein
MWLLTGGCAGCMRKESGSNERDMVSTGQVPQAEGGRD